MKIKKDHIKNTKLKSKTQVVRTILYYLFKSNDIYHLYKKFDINNKRQVKFYQIKK